MPVCRLPSTSLPSIHGASSTWLQHGLRWRRGESRTASAVAAVPGSPRCHILLEARVILSPEVYMVVTNVGLIKCPLFTALVASVRQSASCLTHSCGKAVWTQSCTSSSGGGLTLCWWHLWMQTHWQSSPMASVTTCW